jgi:hypothetical protein
VVLVLLEREVGGEVIERGVWEVVLLGGIMSGLTGQTGEDFLGRRRLWVEPVRVGRRISHLGNWMMWENGLLIACLKVIGVSLLIKFK